MKISLAGLSNIAKNALIDAYTDKISISEFYLTNTDNSEEIQLCLPPDKLSVKTGANFRNYSVVELGEIKLPKGSRLENISWSGILPGAHILHYPFVMHEAWDVPNEIAITLHRWQEAGDKIKLLVTQTPLMNLEVYLKDFSFEASGGNGDLKYSLSLISARELEILTVEESDSRREAESQLKERPRQKSQLGKQIKTVDDIYSIIRFLSGQGSLEEVLKILSERGVFDLEGSTPDDFEPTGIIWV